MTQTMTKTRWTQIVAWLLAIAGIVLIGLGGMVLSGRFPRAATTQSRLQTVRETGYLRCGIEGGLSGFSVVSGDPAFWKDGLAYFDDAQGFDADFCRVIAVAVFGTAVNHLYFIPLNVEQRFQAVKDGTVDVLVRNTTWTAGRDIHVGIDFGPVIFHDGQKFLVPVDSDIYTLADLNGKQICVLPGTTSIDNVRTTFDDLGMSYELISERRPGVDFNDNEDVIEAYLRLKCDAITSDESQLLARRAEVMDPDAHRIVPPTAISYEPLAPVYRQGDNQWRDIVNYAVWSTIYAEQLGINSTNLATFDETANDTIRSFLGAAGANSIFATDLELAPNFAGQIVAEVGNYGEIFDQNLSGMFTTRGPNTVWTNDPSGRIFSPPFTQ